MRPLLIFLLSLFSTIISAQNTTSVKDNRVFQVVEVEQMPQFPGGDDAKLKFINSNLQYPAANREQGIQGRVWVNFIVTGDGTLRNIKIEKGLSPQLDAEALRIVSLFPQFTPGKHAGLPVAVSYSQPIMFHISSYKEQLHKAYKQ
jgi:TonB family protein